MGEGPVTVLDRIIPAGEREIYLTSAFLSPLLFVVNTGIYVRVHALDA
jgi:hypothetical protein